MGIPGLLKVLGDIQRNAHLSEYRGLRVALDAYCFLHRGKYKCSMELLTGQKTTAFLGPAIDLIEALRAHGAEPFVVFDGGLLPAKKSTETARQHAREESHWKAAVSLHGAHCEDQQVIRHLGSAVDVTPEMAWELIKHLRVLEVAFVVAPYEADSQLAYLARTGRVDVCITEDADLLAFGCPRILFGVNSSGYGREIHSEDLPRSRGLAPYRLSSETIPDLCVLAGCDYLPSIPRVGLKTASRLLHRSGGDVNRAVQLARREGFAVPTDYANQFARARLVFASQTIFDIELGCTRPLSPLPDDVVTSPGYLGPILESKIAVCIAQGELNPLTLEPFANIENACASGPRISVNSHESDDNIEPTLQIASEQGRPLRLATSTETEVAKQVVPALSTGTKVLDQCSLHMNPSVSLSALKHFRPPRQIEASSSRICSGTSALEMGVHKRRRLGCRIACA